MIIMSSNQENLMFHYDNFNSMRKINKVIAQCILFGDNFSPKKLKQISDMPLESDSNEKGDYNDGTKQPYEYGVCSIEDEDKYDLDKMLNLLLDNKHKLDEARVDDIRLTLVNLSYSDFASCYIEPKVIDKIIKLGIDGLCIDYYRYDS